MSLHKKIKNIIFYYIKIHYKEYLQKHSLKYIPNEEIKKVIDDFYLHESKNLKQFIRETLEKMMDEDYPGPIVENIIFEIFEDAELAKKRVCMEIQLYQDNNREMLEKEILNNSYEVYLTPNKEYGLGLVINIENDGIFVKDFKKIDGIVLPAEKCDMIHVGDRLIKINEYDLNSMPIQEAVNLIKNYNSKTEEVSLQFLNQVKFA